MKIHIDIFNAVLQSDDATLDELQEIVDYIKANRSELESLSVSNIAGLQNVLDGKVNAVSGKGLSSNDYTGAEKNKLAGIEAGAQANVGDTFNASGNYAGLRARGTTKADVGLESVRNVTSYSQSEADVRFLPKGTVDMGTLP